MLLWTAKKKGQFVTNERYIQIFCVQDDLFQITTEKARKNQNCTNMFYFNRTTHFMHGHVTQNQLELWKYWVLFCLCLLLGVRRREGTEIIKFCLELEVRFIVTHCQTVAYFKPSVMTYFLQCQIWQDNHCNKFISLNQICA